MDISAGEIEIILNVTFFVALLSWLLLGTFRAKASSSSSSSCYIALFIVISNAIISTSYLGFGIYEYLNDNNHDVYIYGRLFTCFSTWLLATLVSSLHSKRRGRASYYYWPFVLILWWVFSAIVGSLSLTLLLVSYFDSNNNNGGLGLLAVDSYYYCYVASFPLCVLLCFTSFWCVVKSRRQSDHDELETSLLLDDEDLNESESESACFADSGVWSKTTFRWLNPLFETGRSKKIELHDIPRLPQSETAQNASTLLEDSIRRSLKLEEPSLARAILGATSKSLAVNALFAGLNTAASYTGPLLITNFVNYLLEKREGSSIRYGLALAFVFFFAKTLESLTQRQWYFGAHRIGVRVRAALTVLIYNKSISVKFCGPSNGKIVNLINVDVERIGDCCWYIHGVWLLPLQVFLALVILYRNLGAAPSAAALLATMMVMVSNTPLANSQESLHSKIMEAKDSRIKVTSETLKSMRVLKLNSWEPEFLKRIIKLREAESNWLRRYLYTCSAVAFLFWASPTLVSVVTFGVCVLLGTPLTAGTVLSALATFRILQEPIYNLPELISMIAQTKVSLDRVHEFTREDRKSKVRPLKSSNSSNISIQIEKAEFSWDASDQITKIPTIKLTEKIKIMRGWKVAVCGSVGSGKSSLLCSMLDEIPRTSGVGIKVHGSRAYVPQSAWIQTGTVRENVLFGKKMELDRYERVLGACGLDRDMKVWQGGDNVVVGERGMNLSGGQKQRIQLARAVYSESDVYFLDDPFSAVDALTGTHLFKECLLKLLSQKTVVYATHQLEFLEAADLVLVMKDGRVAQSGRYEDLISDLDGELITQMNAHRKSLTHVNTCQQDDSFTGVVPSRKNQIEVVEDWFRDSTSNANLEKSQEEEAETGRVKWSVYSTFVTSAYRGALVPVILVCQVIFQGLQMGSNYWLAWATEKTGRVTNKQLLGIFVLLSGGSSVFILGRAVLMAKIAIETSQRLFRGMIASIFRAPILFFDSTPSSRILSRSSTDQSTVDTDIPYRLAGLAFALIQLLSIIILMSQVAWQVFLLFLAVIGISIWYQAYYISTARELARMVGIRKSPVLHHFSESISGSATIRCFKQEDRFSMRAVSLVDDYSRVAFHNSATMEWLSVRINFLFNLVFFLVLIILVTLPCSAIDPSLAGLVATYGLNLNVLQAWVIWNLCNVENKMISVERILQFTNIPSEAPLVVEECRPNPEWPEEGKIELEDLHVQYNPALPMVLKGISCTFPASKKIGIVGRTGSGKSTLIQALFRVVEPRGGMIRIDGVDITKMGLQDLRSRLGIIPQDPTLFQGTMRTNLDPLQEHPDHELWEVLNKCRLADIVRQDQRLLDAPVAEDGENWSVGQRQLVCLARVLLKKRRILVLDEATASIDTATDNVIQETIREETNGCTVITVAHRIPTVIDNDLVLVLDDGKVIEYDAPTLLLEDKASSFSKLVTEFLRRSSRTHCHDVRS